MTHFQQDLLVALRKCMSFETQQFILDNVDNVNFGSSVKTNPLLMILYNYNDEYNPEIFKMLMEKNADPKTKDRTNKTALHYAAESGFVNAMDILIKKGANIFSNDMDDKDIIDYSEETGDKDVINYVTKLFIEDDKTKKLKDNELDLSFESNDESNNIQVTLNIKQPLTNNNYCNAEEFDVEITGVEEVDVEIACVEDKPKLIVTQNDIDFAKEIAEEKKKNNEKQNEKQNEDLKLRDGITVLDKDLYEEVDASVISHDNTINEIATENSELKKKIEEYRKKIENFKKVLIN